MDELMIKTHDFELAKNGLKEFSEQATTDLDLQKAGKFKGVGEWVGDFILGGGIGIGHKVTGEELNELTTQIQKHLIDINTMHERFIKEFGQVYNALEALDKDYIQAILISIKATEETSKRIEATQEQITKIVDDQRKTLEVLKKFKREMEGENNCEEADELTRNNGNRANGGTGKANTTIQMLNKKIEVAYWLAGSSLGLALIQLAMMLLKTV